MADGPVAAGDIGLNQLGVSAESRWAFGGIENPNPSAGTGAKISEASALFEGNGNQLNSTADVFGFGSNGERDFGPLD